MEEVEQVLEDPKFRQLWESFVDEKIYMNSSPIEMAAAFYLMGSDKNADKH